MRMTPETPKLIEILNRNENNIPIKLIEALSGKGNIDHKYNAFTPEIINNFENKDRLYMALFYLKEAALYRNRARENKTNNPKIYIFDSGEFVKQTLKVLGFDIKEICATDIDEARKNIYKFSLQGLYDAIFRVKRKKAKEFLEAILEKYSNYKKSE